MSHIAPLTEAGTMLEHRFRNLLAETAVAPAPLSIGGFTACPSPLLQGWSCAHQGWVGQLYRLAYERAQAELHTLPRYFRFLTASMN